MRAILLKIPFYFAENVIIFAENFKCYMRNMKDSRIIEYNGISFSCIHNNNIRETFSLSDHALVYLSSGSLEISDHDNTVRMTPGECVFIWKDCSVTLTKSMGPDGSPFKSIMIVFERKFLFRYYRSIKSEHIDAERSSSPIMRIPSRPDTVSLFTSLMPFFWSEDKPSEDWVIGKKTEGLDCILRTDSNVYASLFDFSGRWKIDLAAFMEENYTQNLSLEELANYTGRSLSSFNRDFRKIYGTLPQKWIISRRLEKARSLLAECPIRVQDAMAEAGFTNLSHFSRVYKEKYGHSPSEEFMFSMQSREQQSNALPEK